MTTLTAKERRAVCPDCGCVAYSKDEHASRCPRGSDPTGKKLTRLIRRVEKRNAERRIGDPR